MPISKKQLKILAFPYTKHQSLICDGAVRSGKTSMMTLAFVDWAMSNFNRTNFGICGKTVGSAIKNIIVPYMSLSYSRQKYGMKFLRNENKMVVTQNGKENTFYVYGGKDESSYMLIQGITLAGVLLDEVALMTRSFVEQALARCLSYANRRYWFNCNPAGPSHWFYEEWVAKPEKHRAMHLHFLMSDNPALSEETIAEASLQHSGVFYRRYVLGEWCAAEGAIYPMFDNARHVVNELPKMRRSWVSVDYGHTNPTVFLHIGEGIDGNAYVIREWMHEKGDNAAISPKAYSNRMREFLSKTPEDLLDTFDGVYVDPSAEGFIAQLKEDLNIRVRGAENSVLPGIMLVSSMLDTNVLKIHKSCTGLIRELQSYVWDDKARLRGEDKPLKVADHYCDALRYGCMADKNYWKRRVANGNQPMAASGVAVEPTPR